jgi:predicted RNase H-like nuclease (RuvC/YqgF family)
VAAPAVGAIKAALDAVVLRTRERDEARAELADIRVEVRKYDARDLPLKTVDIVRAMRAEVERLRTRVSDLENACMVHHDEVERLRAALDQIDRETRSASDVTVIRLGSIAREAKRKAGL